MSENKYVDLVNESKVTTSDAEVNAAVEKILAEHYEENNNNRVHKFLLGAIDLTTLKSTDSPASVAAFTQKVNEFEEKYPDLPGVAAIANQTGTDLTEALHRNLDKKTRRDATRHKDNPRLRKPAGD